MALAMDQDAVMATALDAGQLAELVESFSAVTSRLQETHEQLRGEVVRLQGELVETRRQLARARELASLGEMAAGIAHEVRNPLGSIGLYAEALVQDLSDRGAERGIALKIVDSVRRLNAVVGDVLAFAREMRVEQNLCEVRDLLERAAESVRGTAADAGVRIEVLASSGVVLGDAGLLLQALVNLVRNGVEASAEHAGGKLVVLGARPRRVMDAEGGAREMLGLAVLDSGPGIPRDVCERMFNPFFTTRATGTGLGLSIVHRIVDAHGGRVRIGSAAEHGLVGELTSDDAALLCGASVELMAPSAESGAGVVRSQGAA